MDSNQTFTMSPRDTFTERYKISKVLGRGTYGTVYTGNRICDSLPVVIKTIRKYRIDPAARELPLEVSFLHRLSHIKGVIRLIDACISHKQLIIVMEHIESSMDLHKLMQRKMLAPELTRSLFRQLVETVIECHAAGIIHRDIKTENILFDPSTETIKLIDFGCASYAKEFYPTMKGTPLYHPPEVFRTRIYHSEAATVWSLGLVLFTMANGVFPDYHIRKLTKEEVETVTFREKVPEQCQDLIQLLLKYDWKERLSLKNVLDHPYLASCSNGIVPCPIVRGNTCLPEPVCPGFTSEGQSTPSASIV